MHAVPVEAVLTSIYFHNDARATTFKIDNVA